MTLNAFTFSAVYPSQPDYELSEARIMSDRILLSLVSAQDSATHEVSRCSINISDQGKLWGQLTKVI